MNVTSTITSTNILNTVYTSTTTSATPGSFILSGTYALRRRMSIDEFLELEDKDLQKWIYMNQHPSPEDKDVKVDNDKKIGYYRVNRGVRINQQGTFYKKSKLLQWIVYDKSTKKVKVSSDNRFVFKNLLKDYIKYPEIVDKFIINATPTICKKIIEGKINDVRSVMCYHKSYTLRSKSLEEETVYKFMANDLYRVITVFEDPNEVAKKDNFKEKIKNLDINYLANKPFKIKWDEIDNVNERYGKWDKEQSEKYDSFIRSRPN